MKSDHAESDVQKIELYICQAEGRLKTLKCGDDLSNILFATPRLVIESHLAGFLFQVKPQGKQELKR